MLKKGLFTILELLIRLSVSPRLRAWLLRLLGAKIGKNVRVYECRFINLGEGFENLVLGDDVHVGTGCLLDLEGRVEIARGSTLSPRCNLISHTDPGASHRSPLVDDFPPERNGIVVAECCWIGTGSTLISGARVGREVVVGAMSLVRGNLPERTVCAGIPARVIRSLKTARSQP